MFYLSSNYFLFIAEVIVFYACFFHYSQDHDDDIFVLDPLGNGAPRGYYPKGYC